jgi:hypothetical protein
MSTITASLTTTNSTIAERRLAELGIMETGVTSNHSNNLRLTRQRCWRRV